MATMVWFPAVAEVGGAAEAVAADGGVDAQPAPRVAISPSARQISDRVLNRGDCTGIEHRKSE